MSVDSKQFNRTVLGYEEVEQHIRRAQRLRSEAIAHSARRSAAAIRAHARRLRAFIGGALHANDEKGGGAPRFGWSPAASAAGRSARCK